MIPFGHGATQLEMGNHLWGGNMFGNPHAIPDMMMGLENVSPAPNVAISTTTHFQLCCSMPERYHIP
jgi:hypothetical protein